MGAFLAFYAFVGFERFAKCLPRKPKTEKEYAYCYYGQFHHCFVAVYSCGCSSRDFLAPRLYFSYQWAPMAEIVAIKGQDYAYAISVISLVAVFTMEYWHKVHEWALGFFMEWPVRTVRQIVSSAYIKVSYFLCRLP